MSFQWQEPAGSTTRRVPGGLGRISPVGDVYYVQSVHASASDTNAGTRPQAPLATLDAAINKCTANAGDTIIVLEGHAENIANATTVIPDIAGIHIKGDGRGAKRPTFTFTAAAGNIPISGANIKVENLLLTVSGTTDVTSGITVTGADCDLEDIEVRDASATAQFAIGVTLSTGADRAKITRPILRSHASGDALTAGIHCAVALDGVEVIGPRMDGLASNGLIYNVTAAMTNLSVVGGRLRQRHATNDSAIKVHASTTGFIDGVRIRTATNDADGFNLAIVAAAMQVYDAYVVNADGEQGALWGTQSNATGAVAGELRFVSKTLAFTGAADLGAIGNVPWFTATGEVLIASIMPTCTETLVSAGGGSLALGVTGSTSFFIAPTLATDIANGDLWIDATPTEVNAVALPAGFQNQVLTDNIVGTVTTGAITDGTIRVDIYYRPLSSDGLLAAA